MRRKKEERRTPPAVRLIQKQTRITTLCSSVHLKAAQNRSINCRTAWSQLISLFLLSPPAFSLANKTTCWNYHKYAFQRRLLPFKWTAARITEFSSLFVVVWFGFLLPALFYKVVDAYMQNFQGAVLETCLALIDRRRKKIERRSGRGRDSEQCRMIF